MATNFKLLQACSNNFLTTQIPDNFLDLDEFQQYQFLSTHAWQPVENLSPDNIWQLIESSADTMSTFFQQYVQAPHGGQPECPKGLLKDDAKLRRS